MTQLKTHIFETPKARVLVVDLPNDAMSIIFEEVLNIISYRLPELPATMKDLPEGDWQLIGKLSEITEENTITSIVGRDFKNYKVCQQLNQQPQYDMYWVKYPDGSHKHFDTKDECYAHALKMELLYLIESEVSLRNPHGENRDQRCVTAGEPGDYASLSREWQAAEDQVYHNPILFVDYKK